MFNDHFYEIIKKVCPLKTSIKSHNHVLFTKKSLKEIFFIENKKN